MTGKCVLLIESGQFIGGVIKNLFAHQQNLNVVAAAPTNKRELLQAVQLYQPEIIVLDDTVRADYLALLLRSLPEGPDVRVIVVNTDSNQVQVYQKQQINVSQTADFFAIL